MSLLVSEEAGPQMSEEVGNNDANIRSCDWFENVLETHNQEPNLIQTRLEIAFSTPSKQQSEPPTVFALCHPLATQPAQCRVLENAASDSVTDNKQARGQVD